MHENDHKSRWVGSYRSKKYSERTSQFFENLYTTRKIDSVSNSKIKETFLTNINIPKLDQDVKSNLDLPISIDELSHALKNMKNDKSPGLDGFTANFYNSSGMT